MPQKKKNKGIKNSTRRSNKQAGGAGAGAGGVFKNKRDITLREDGEVYAQVVKVLGNSTVDTFCFDGVRRICHIRGSMRKKKIWIAMGDIVLVSQRSFQQGKGDVILKYTPDEVNILKTQGELPEALLSAATDSGGGGGRGGSSSNILEIIFQNDDNDDNNNNDKKATKTENKDYTNYANLDSDGSGDSSSDDNVDIDKL